MVKEWHDGFVDTEVTQFPQTKKNCINEEFNKFSLCKITFTSNLKKECLKHLRGKASHSYCFYRRQILLNLTLFKLNIKVSCQLPATNNIINRNTSIFVKSSYNKYHKTKYQL